MTQKVCIRCKENKQDIEYSSSRKRICKDCDNKPVKKVVDPNIPKKPRSNPKDKKCISCDLSGDKVKIRKNQVICINCENDPNVIYDKFCESCNIAKKNTDFSPNRKKCIDCVKAYGRNYRRTTTKAKEWVENNRERMSELQHNNYEKNKKTIRETEQERRKEDPHFRMVKSYRASIGSFIMGKSKTNKKLDASRDNFLTWISFCFTDGMNMDNRLKIWQIDHVIPIDYYENPIIKENEASDSILCWYNIMPVLKEHNLKKNKYFDSKQALLHIRNLDEYLKKNERIKESLLENKNYLSYRKSLQKILDESYLQGLSSLGHLKDFATNQVLETLSGTTGKDRLHSTPKKNSKIEKNVPNVIL